MKSYAAWFAIISALSVALSTVTYIKLTKKHATFYDALKNIARNKFTGRKNNTAYNSSDIATHSMRISNVTEQIHPPPCSGQGSKLVGALKIDLDAFEQSFIKFEAAFKGTYRLTDQWSPVFEPDDCQATLSVAIIIPFRDREQHLHYLLGHLYPILQRQQLRYQVFVVEQTGNGTFNKGRLMNTGFKHARNISGIDFDCYIFHDVDMLPENDRNIYKCFPGTRDVLHLSCSVDKFRYRPLCCGMTVGGVLSFSKQQFKDVNGFSNSFWGWGGEDDDMNQRIRKKGFVAKRPTFHLCRYTMIKHDRDKLNPYNQTIVDAKVDDSTKDSSTEGLSNLNTQITSVQRQPLFIRILVNVDPKVT